jgi:preprotein translocase SecE subunit
MPEFKIDKAELKRQKAAEKEALKEQAKIDKEKAQKKKEAAKKEKKSLLKRLKETFSELKKVTWAKLPYVVRSTGVVISVVLFFVLVLLGFDYVLGLIHGIFIG